MHARLTELWLDSASERSFQIPFCACLAAQGHTVLHLTRHCGMELGKDVITRNRAKQLCVYQLKDARGSRVTLEWWRANIEPQLLSLCNTAVIHGSVKLGTKHKPYVVIDGDLNEEVSAHIVAFNAIRPEAFQLEVVVRGQLLEAFDSLGTSFWPESDTVNYRNVLEMFLSTGNEMFPKQKLAEVLESLSAKQKRISKTETVRLCSSCLLLTTLVSDRFQQRNNHFAEFEAWTLCLSNIIRLGSEAGLKDADTAMYRQIASEAAIGALERLCDEVRENPGLSQGSPFSDHQLRGARLTLVCGGLATYSMWRRWRKETLSERDEFIAQYIREKYREFVVPGECAGSAILAVCLFLGIAASGCEKEDVINRYLLCIFNNNYEAPNADKNAPRLVGLPSAYYGWDEAALLCLGFNDQVFQDTFTNTSSTCRVFFDLLVRTNSKQACRVAWPWVSHFCYEEFRPNRPSDRLRWNCELGVVESVIFPRRQNWTEVFYEAREASLSDWPDALRVDPGALLAFLLTFPHRLNRGVARWLDEKSWECR